MVIVKNFVSLHTKYYPLTTPSLLHLPFLLNHQTFETVLERLSLFPRVQCNINFQDFRRQNLDYGPFLRDIISNRSLFLPRLLLEAHKLTI